MRGPRGGRARRGSEAGERGARSGLRVIVFAFVFVFALVLGGAFVGGVCASSPRCLGAWMLVSLYLAYELYLGHLFILNELIGTESWRTLVASRLVHRAQRGEMMLCWCVVNLFTVMN